VSNAGGSVRTIADRVGVSAPALLQHFGSKEGC
jgi:AcrR family transcriptional regulator